MFEIAGDLMFQRDRGYNRARDEANVYARKLWWRRAYHMTKTYSLRSDVEVHLACILPTCTVKVCTRGVARRESTTLVEILRPPLLIGYHHPMKWATLLADLAESKERKKLQSRIQRLIDKWQPILGVSIDWDLRKMKMYWGSSNKATRHITFNTELAQLPPRYIEYIVVHELVHHRTDGHDPRFYELMDEYLPGWRKMNARIEEPLRRYS